MLFCVLCTCPVKLWLSGCAPLAPGLADLMQFGMRIAVVTALYMSTIKACQAKSYYAHSKLIRMR